MSCTNCEEEYREKKERYNFRDPYPYQLHATDKAQHGGKAYHTVFKGRSIMGVYLACCRHDAQSQCVDEHYNGGRYARMPAMR